MYLCFTVTMSKEPLSQERLLSRFRCGCYGLHVDTGPLVNTKNKDRLCHVYTTHLETWKTSSVSCLVAQLTVVLDRSMPVLFSRPSVKSWLSTCAAISAVRVQLEGLGSCS